MVCISEGFYWIKEYGLSACQKNANITYSGTITLKQYDKELT